MGSVLRTLPVGETGKKQPSYRIQRQDIAEAAEISFKNSIKLYALVLRRQFSRGRAIPFRKPIAALRLAAFGIKGAVGGNRALKTLH
jgi:hypothetical protein